MSTVIDEILNSDLTMRVRNNHALEHATLHVLQQKGIKNPLGGISDMGGFWIYGRLSTDLLLKATQEALKRLVGGETELAVHPNCGTNIAVGSLAAGGLAWAATIGIRGKTKRILRRLPIAVLLGVIGYQLARPLGPKLQEQITTNADIQGIEVTEVVKHDLLGHTIHRVSTRTTR